MLKFCKGLAVSKSCRTFADENKKQEIMVIDGYMVMQGFYGKEERRQHVTRFSSQKGTN
jgi:mannose-6-phosphate isomerase class I